jgi:AcrR family transcriptional regulator
MPTTGFFGVAMSERSAAEPDARARIVECARELVSKKGWEAAGSAQVARAAEVSKALVHYHFGDKTALLIAVGESCRVRIRDRAQHTKSPAASQANPVDDFADWVEAEIDECDLRVIQQLMLAPNPLIRHEATSAGDGFRVALATQVRRVFSRLELESRVAEQTIVDLFEAICSGMAAGAASDRQTIEAAWLAVLTLAE